MLNKDQIKGRLRQIDNMAIRHSIPLAFYKKVKIMYFLNELSAPEGINREVVNSLDNVFASMKDNKEVEAVLYSKEVQKVIYIYWHSGKKAVILVLDSDGRERNGFDSFVDMKNYLESELENGTIKAYINEYGEEVEELEVEPQEEETEEE